MATDSRTPPEADDPAAAAGSERAAGATPEQAPAGDAPPRAAPAVDAPDPEVPSSEPENRFFREGDAASGGGPETAADPEVDPELLRLPRRRRRRHPLISLIVVGMSLYLMWFVHQDLFFFFQPRQAADQGEAAEALRTGKLRPNTHVRISGAPDRKHSLILEGRFGGYDSFFRLLETGDRVFIQQHRETRATDEIVTGSHAGQLVLFRSLPYSKGVATFFNRTMTVGHDLDFAEVVRAKAGGAVVTVKDQRGMEVALNPDSVFWINVAYPDEWLIQFSKRTYASLEETRKLIEGLELPLTVDEEKSASHWRYVVLAGPEAVPPLMARFKDPALHVSVVRRQVSYSARWDQLGLKGRTLVVSATDATSSRYQVVQGEGSVVKEGARPRLVLLQETPVEIPEPAILFISTSSPFTIAPDALVLLAGKVPGEHWYYVVLYLLLLTFIILNALSLISRWRERALEGRTGRV